MESLYEREHATTAQTPFGTVANTSILALLLEMETSDAATEPYQLDLHLLEQMAGVNPGGLGPKPSKASIKALIREEIHQQMDREAQCMICLEKVIDDCPCQDDGKASDEDKIETPLLRMPCDHVYHTKCLLLWLEKTNTCPACRHELKTVAQEEKGIQKGLLCPQNTTLKERRDADLEELHESMFS